MRFERSGRGQEPSRGHKFSILENVVLHRDFTSQALASFPSDLVGACLPQTLLTNFLIILDLEALKALLPQYEGKVKCILLRSDGFPTLHIGKRMVVPKDRFLQWITDSVNG